MKSNSNYLGILVAVALLALSLTFINSGCDQKDVKDQQNTQQFSAVDQDGQVVRIVMVTPSREEHYGTSTHVKREVKMARIMSPFGVSAGEVIETRTDEII